MAKHTLSSINKEIEETKKEIGDADLSAFARSAAKQALVKLEKEKADLEKNGEHKKTATPVAKKASKPVAKKAAKAKAPAHSAISELETKIAKTEKGIASALLSEDSKKQLREHLVKFKSELEAIKSKAASVISTAKTKAKSSAVVKAVEKAKARIEAAKKPAKKAVKKTAKKVAVKKTSHKDIVKKYAHKGKYAKQIKEALKGGRPYENVLRDSKRRALKPGKRLSKDGNTYYEYRVNRSDKQRHRMAFLETGGIIDGNYHISEHRGNFQGDESAMWVRVTHYGEGGVERTSGQALAIHGGDRDKAIAAAKNHIAYETEKEKTKSGYESGGSLGKTYIVNSHEERGEWTLDVSDPQTQESIWDYRYDGSGENESSIIEDGFMKHTTDIDGLEKYLKQMEVIASDDHLVFEKDYEEPEEDEEDMPTWVADEAGVSKSDFEPLVAFLAAKGYTPDSIPYTTDGGTYEFYIGRKGDEIGVALYVDEKTHSFEEMILSKKVLKEIGETARIAGINKIVVYSNLGVDIHSRNYNEDIKKLGIDQIVKVSQSDIFDTGQYAKGGKTDNQDTRETGGELSRSKLQSLFAIYNYQDILAEDRENMPALEKAGYIYMRGEQPALTSRGISALVESENKQKAAMNFEEGGAVNGTIYEVYNEDRDELELMNEQELINYANTVGTYELRDEGAEDFTTVDDAIAFLEASAYKVTRNDMKRGGLTAKHTYYLVASKEEGKLPFHYSKTIDNQLGEYSWEEGEKEGEKLMQAGKAKEYALYNKRSKDRSLFAFLTYEKGGKIYQNEPENKNYSWRKDKKEKSKPAGWRFTEAGAKN
jgi:hypothetical protein